MLTSWVLSLVSSQLPTKKSSGNECGNEWCFPEIGTHVRDALASLAVPTKRDVQPKFNNI